MRTHARTWALVALVIAASLAAAACGRTITGPPPCVTTVDTMAIVHADTLAARIPITFTACGFGR